MVSVHADDFTFVTDDASSVQFLYNCAVYTQAGTYPNVPYGDGTRTLNLAIYQYKSSEDQEATIELGQTLLFGCRPITPSVAGDTEYFDTIPETGYDRIVKLTLHTLEPEPVLCDTAYKTIQLSINEGDTLIFGCQQIFEEGTYQDKLRKADNSCDSIVTLELSFYTPEPIECDTAYETIQLSINEGDTLIFGCQQIFEEGTYQDKLRKADNSCDSIVTLELSFYTPEPVECDTARFEYVDSIYAGDTLLFGCQQLYEAGIYYDRLAGAAANGCDSIVTLTLKINEAYDSIRAYAYDTIYDTVCVGSTYMIREAAYIVEAEMNVNDTIADALEMIVDEDLHQHIYTDSVITYYLSVWQPSDTTVQDSIELGQTYTFKNEEFTPEQPGVMLLHDTLANIHGCDSFITVELKVIEVQELREYVYGEKQDTLCLGATYQAGSQTVVVDGDMTVNDTVFAVRQVKDDVLHTLTFTDSVTTYTILTWHEGLDVDDIEWGYAFCGEPYTGAEQVLEKLREAIAADDLFGKDTVLSVLWRDESGAYVPYTGSEMSPETDEISLRVEVSNACTTFRLDTTLAIQKPDYELSDQFGDMPAVSKYNDWLLMINLDSLNKVYGLYPEPDSVRWFRITGAEPDITADEQVGTGYYYTDDRHLVGAYYAIITLPEQTDACGGSWRTRIVVRTTETGPQLAPNIVRQGEPMWLYHLQGSGDLHIYGASGVCVRVVHYDIDAADANGIVRISTDVLPAGVYMMHINNVDDHAAMPFIIKE